PPLTPHSFPTRSSSDLGGAAPVDDLSAPDHDIVHTQAPFDDAGPRPPAARSRATLRCAVGIVKRGRALAGRPLLRLHARARNGQDRKSTRLNSSHEWIS